MSDKSIIFERVGCNVRLIEVADPGVLDDCVEIPVDEWDAIVDKWIADTRPQPADAELVERLKAEAQGFRSAHLHGIKDPIYLKVAENLSNLLDEAIAALSGKQPEKISWSEAWLKKVEGWIAIAEKAKQSQCRKDEYNKLLKELKQYREYGIDKSGESLSAKQDGVKRYSTEILASEMQMLDSRGQQSQGGQQQSRPQQQPQGGGQSGQPQAGGNFTQGGSFDNFDQDISF